MSSLWEPPGAGSMPSVDRNKTTTPTKSVNIAPSVPASPPQNVSPLQQIKDGSYAGDSLTQAASSGDETAPLQHATTSGGEGVPETLDNLNLAMGQLTILPESEGGTLYAGGTAWDSVFAQFAELKTLL